MEIKELIDTLRICADGDIICSACPRYDRSLYGGSAYCFYELMMEAAETIESQQKRISELEAALREQEERRWIPVTERLPEKAAEYLCRCCIGEADWYPIHMVLRYYLVDENPHFQHECEHGLRVTHWMPLPEPPKEE